MGHSSEYRGPQPACWLGWKARTVQAHSNQPISPVLNTLHTLDEEVFSRDISRAASSSSSAPYPLLRTNRKIRNRTARVTQQTDVTSRALIHVDEELVVKPHEEADMPVHSKGGCK